MIESRQTPPEGPPAIFMAEQQVERALAAGAVSIHASRENIENVVRYATNGNTVRSQTGLDLGAVAIRDFGSLYKPRNVENFLSVPEDGSLATAMGSNRVNIHDVRDMTSPKLLKIMDVRSRGTPTEDKLARGLYNSANRLTTNKTTGFSSKNDRWFGTAMGAALGLTDDALYQGNGFPSLIEFTGVPYATGGAAGLIAGRLLLAPVLGGLRRSYDLKLVRKNDAMPFRIRYASLPR